MTARSGAWLVFGLAALVAGIPAGTVQAAAKSKPTLTKPTLDPAAPKVDFFEAIQKGVLEARLIPKDEKGGTFFVENLTGQPVSIQLPEAFVGVQVLKQFGGGAFGGPAFGGGAGGVAGAGGVGGLGGGGGQPLGGGVGGGGGFPGGGGGLGGGGFFSVPAETIVRVPYQSVCLAHGKPDPTPRMTYRVVPVEAFDDDPLLKQLLVLFGGGRIEQSSAQAAAWHVVDGMSWQELAGKQVKHIGGRATPYFNANQLQSGQSLVATAQARVKEQAQSGTTAKPEAPATEPIRTRIAAPASGTR